MIIKNVQFILLLNLTIRHSASVVTDHAHSRAQIYYRQYYDGTLNKRTDCQLRWVLSFLGA